MLIYTSKLRFLNYFCLALTKNTYPAKVSLQIIILFMLASMQTSYARTVEVEVYGMTCAFCADNMTRKFERLESVSKVDVSLKVKKIRLETDDNLPSIDTINQTIIDAGFTPVKTTVLSDEK